MKNAASLLLGLFLGVYLLRLVSLIQHGNDSG